MLIKLFVFGPPGSGKSTISRAIVEHVHYNYRQWSAQRICDYNILYNMFKQEKKHKDFYPIKYGGFYVTNPVKYDDALKQLEQSVISLSNKGNKLLLIEFSRSDYIKTFTLFGEGFFQNAGFLFLHADLETCMRRVSERIKNPLSIDDHYVSETTLTKYEHTDEMHHLMAYSHLEHNYNVRSSRYSIIKNDGATLDTINAAIVFADEVIKQGYQFHPWETNGHGSGSQSTSEDEIFYHKGESPLLSVRR